jgi:hypothetical protein
MRLARTNAYKTSGYIFSFGDHAESFFDASVSVVVGDGRTTLFYVWGIRNQALRAIKIKECFSRSDSCTKDPEAKSLEPLNLSSSFRSRFSA